MRQYDARSKPESAPATSLAGPCYDLIRGRSLHQRRLWDRARFAIVGEKLKLTGRLLKNEITRTLVGNGSRNWTWNWNWNWNWTCGHRDLLERLPELTSRPGCYDGPTNSFLKHGSRIRSTAMRRTRFGPIQKTRLPFHFSPCNVEGAIRKLAETETAISRLPENAQREARLPSRKVEV